MKLNGVFGKGTGKVGNSVWAVSGGVQIVRPYNPNVSNPNTDAQVEQRAKFKLMSQLAADMKSAIVISKIGLKSSRNLFVKKNIGFAEFQDANANVRIEDIQLTDGNSAFPAPVASAGAGNATNIALSESAGQDINVVVYAIFKKNDGSNLEFIANVTVNTPGNDRKFGTTRELPAGEFVIYAYGIKSNGGAASANYDNYFVEAESPIATLEIVRKLIELSGGVTKTTSVTYSLE